MAMTPPFTRRPSRARPRSAAGNPGKLTAAHAMSSTTTRAPGTVPSTAKAIATRWSAADRTRPRGGASVPLHVEIVSQHLGLAAHRADVRGHQLQPVALLHPELAHTPEDRLTPRAGREDGEQRDLVDERGNLAGSDLGRPEIGRTRDQIGHRLTECVGGSFQGHRRRPCAGAR